MAFPGRPLGKLNSPTIRGAAWFLSWFWSNCAEGIGNRPGRALPISDMKRTCLTLCVTYASAHTTVCLTKSLPATSLHGFEWIRLPDTEIWTAGFLVMLGFDGSSGILTPAP